MDEDEPCSSNWEIERKAVSLPNFCADNNGSVFKVDNEDELFIQKEYDYINNNTRIMLRSPSPQIVITPPPIDRTFRYAPYLKSTPYPKSRVQRFFPTRSAVQEYKPQLSRWPSRMFKRRNAVSTSDLSYLRDAGRSLLAPPEMSDNLTIEFKNPKEKCKKQVTFTTSSPIIRRQDEEYFADISNLFNGLERITSNCIEISNRNRLSDDAFDSTSADSGLATSFEESCSMTEKPEVVKTEELCTKFSEMPLDEASSNNATSFNAYNTTFNLSCLNL